MGTESIREIEILLVEDHLPDVHLTKRAFRKADIANNIHVAVDGVEALDFLFHRGRHVTAPRPDLILLDLNMPRKGGREVLRVIRSDVGLRDIPVIVLTTSAAASDVKEAHMLGCNAYVVKPLTFPEFAQAILAIEGFWFRLALLPSAE